MRRISPIAITILLMVSLFLVSCSSSPESETSLNSQTAMPSPSTPVASNSPIAKPSLPPPTPVSTPSPTPNVAKSLEGRWVIRQKPRWVDDAYLAFRSNIYQFLPDGTCIWGTATGSYQILSSDQMKVNFQIQEATPGFVGVFTFKISGNELTLKNLAHEEPIILERAAD